MRLVIGLVVLIAAVCAPAEAQRPGGGPKAAKPPGQTTPVAPVTPMPVTPMPETPAGQWDDTILKDAKTQNYDGQAYAAIEFERLQAHVDAICHYDKAATIIGKPVATIAGFRQNKGWPALVDGRQVDIVKPLDENKYLDRLIMPFVLVDVTRFLDDVRNDLYFKTCSGLNFKVCSVAIYGRFRWVDGAKIPDVGADMTIGDKKCIFELEHYRKMGIVDFGDAVNKMALDSFYKGMAVSNAKGGH